MQTKKRQLGSLVREVTSPDGALAFILQRTRTGVRMERRQEMAAPSRTVHASIQARFTSESEFAGFCGEDRLRFDYPLTFHQVHRAFRDLLCLDPLRS